ncbi:hypothetical protein GCM10018793_39420 [Streptomyces sulfonofaciens]|uniref:Uncharacterized protein n=1 Tax=Streptomyces sulfonofaciens TaxID=68272 RepID=A0A919GBT0_9ACTN|nr:hypothetical protein [Streptomyces sulfonofaciens]GHH81620.1 hypothetical protein GCM10018793_39420 [Streptomyces sulfonofaciens]
MAALAWLLIPLVAAVGAGLWGRWAARQRKVGDGPELAGYARFRAAMEKSALEEPSPEVADPDGGSAATGGGPAAASTRV